MAKMILFDTETGKLSWVDANSLDDYYKYLKCDCIDIPSRRVGVVYYDIICDDNGLLVENPVLSAVDGNFRPMLVGNLLFCHHDEEGNETSCNDGDMLNLQRHIRRGLTPDGMINVLEVEY